MTAPTHHHRAIAIANAADLSTLRAATSEMAECAALLPDGRERLNLIVTELATNLVRHSPHGGRVLLRQLVDQAGVECISLDRGPGIENIATALDDGTSTAGGLGVGLGAVRRLSQSFAIHSEPGFGTAILARVGTQPEEAGFARHAGAAMLPMAGMTDCGDGWLIDKSGLIVVVDGLGHGELAGDAARKAIAAARTSDPEPRGVLLAMHEALRGTRGAVGFALFCGEHVLRYAGIGNISATVMRTGSRVALISSWGVLGHNAVLPATRETPWSADDVLLVHSDGIGDATRVFTERRLRFVHPGLIAAIILRDGAGKLDDQTVLVAQR